MAAGDASGSNAMPSTHRAGQPPSSRGSSQFAEDLRQVLRSELLRDTCTAATVAQLFSMHRRTLHRYLQIEGRTFRQVADAVRFEIACEMLANTDTALSQVAATLNYSELSAFTRAFRRWSGQPPSTWRANHPGDRKMDTSKNPISPRLGANQINELAPAEGASGEVFRTLQMRRSRILRRPCSDVVGRSAGQESNPDPTNAGSAGQSCEASRVEDMAPLRHHRTEVTGLA